MQEEEEKEIGIDHDSRSGENPIECDCEAKVLVVDDTDFNLLPVMYLIKETYGIDITTAVDGQIAVEKYK